MAHEIMGNRALFVGQPAWHGLGVVVQNAPTTAEAMVLAGMDWGVSQRPIYDESGEQIQGFSSIVCDLTGDVFNVLTDRFTPVQNADAFKWFDPIIEAGEASIESAGCLRDGRRVWILAKLTNGDTEIVPGDTLANYLLLAHGHDGSLAVVLDLTSIRVVCANTLRAAIGEKGENAAWKLKHTTNVKSKMDEIRDSMDWARQAFREDAELYRRLASRQCNSETLRRIIDRSLKLDDRKKKDAKARNADADLVSELLYGAKNREADATMVAELLHGKSQAQVDYIVESFESGAGADMAGRTLWGAYNAVSDFVSHKRGRTDDSRQNAAWFGEGKAVLERALQGCMLEV